MKQAQHAETLRPAIEATESHFVSLLEALPFEWFVVDDQFRIASFSRSAHDFGISNSVTITDRLVRSALTSAVTVRKAVEFDLELPANLRNTPATTLRVRCCPSQNGTCVVLLEDISRELRVDAMRKDFIVNVSHELKTPVGALLLLAEAIRSAIDDPQSLDRFANRIQMEAERLSKLVSDLTELSRLQTSEISTSRKFLRDACLVRPSMPFGSMRNNAASRFTSSIPKKFRFAVTNSNSSWLSATC